MDKLNKFMFGKRIVLPSDRQVHTHSICQKIAHHQASAIDIPVVENPLPPELASENCEPLDMAIDNDTVDEILNGPRPPRPPAVQAMLQQSRREERQRRKLFNHLNGVSKPKYDAKQARRAARQGDHN